MPSLYHIYISTNTGVTRETVEKQLNLANDWFRYDDKCYVVYTTSDQHKWKSRLKPLVDPNGYLFICKFEASHYEGWMKKSFWDWFEDKAKTP